jgi:hypothetical protein
MRTLYFVAGVALAQWLRSDCAADGMGQAGRVQGGLRHGRRNVYGLAAQKNVDDGAHTAGGVKGRNNSAGGGGSGQALRMHPSRPAAVIRAWRHPITRSAPPRNSTQEMPRSARFAMRH